MSAPQNATLQRLAFAAPAKAANKAVGRMNMGAAVYNRSISTGFLGTMLKYGFYTSLLALFGFLVLHKLPHLADCEHSHTMPFIRNCNITN